MRFVSFLVVLVLSRLISIFAFDTGHHYDATRNGLELRGFSRTSDSIPIVQLCNYVTDWNAIAYEVKLPNFDHYKELASFLHFSNLYNSTMVRDYWVQFLTNQRMTVEAILNDEIKQFTETGATNDTSYQRIDTNFMLLCTLGYTLHATQDFYTHSNFITTLVKPQSNNNINNNDDTCYFTANTFNFSNIASDYNLHTYYYPDKYNETIRSQWPQAAHGLTIHGGYKDGINKDSYAKENFQDAYASAFMGTIDTLDTWRGWIKDDARWAAIQNYNITSPEYGGRLIEGLLATFAVSNYIQVPFTGEDGHWKGPGSGSKKESADIVSDFIHDNWQMKSPFQRTFYDTDISSRLTFGLGKQVPNTSRDELVFIPDVAPDVIANFDAQKLGIIQNDPADYKAIVLRTWGAGKWKTTPSHDDDQEIDGIYAIISIDGQEFREATQYQGWTHPFWTAMRFIPKDQRQVVISYDLMIYATDLSNVFQNDQDIEANIHPPENASSSQAQQATADYNLHTIRPYRVHHTKLMSLAPIGDKIYYKSMSRLSSLRHQLNTRKRMQTMAAAKIVNGIYRDEINPDQMDPYKKGVIFTFDTQTQQVVSGLPDYYLQRTYLDLNHTLRLQGANDINIAQVNVTINVRSMCETTERQRGTLGDTHAAPVAAPDGDWGERPTISGASGLYTTTCTSLSVTLISYASVCVAVLLSLQ